MLACQYPLWLTSGALHKRCFLHMTTSPMVSLLSVVVSCARTGRVRGEYGASCPQLAPPSSPSVSSCGEMLAASVLNTRRVRLRILISLGWHVTRALIAPMAGVQSRTKDGCLLQLLSMIPKAVEYLESKGITKITSGGLLNVLQGSCGPLHRVCS